MLLYHVVVLKSKSNNKDTGKEGTNHKSTRESHDWMVYVAVGVRIAVLIMTLVVEIVGYSVWQQHKYKSGHIQN